MTVTCLYVIIPFLMPQNRARPTRAGTRLQANLFTFLDLTKWARSLLGFSSAAGDGMETGGEGAQNMKTIRTVVVAMGAGVALSWLTATSVEARIHDHRSRRHVERNRYTQEGFQIYAGFGGQGYQTEDNDYEFLDDRGSEGMFFLGAAVGLGDEVSLFLEGAGSHHETGIGDVTFGYTHLGLKIAPATGLDRSWQPYGKISGGAMFLLEGERHHGGWNHDDNAGYVGPSFALGIGVDKFLNRHVALYGEVGMMMGRLDTRVVDGHDYDLGDDIGVTSARLQFGIRLRL